jgi:hypothetical protein
MLEKDAKDRHAPDVGLVRATVRSISQWMPPHDTPQVGKPPESRHTGTRFYTPEPAETDGRGQMLVEHT